MRWTSSLPKLKYRLSTGTTRHLEVLIEIGRTMEDASSRVDGSSHIVILLEEMVDIGLGRVEFE